MRVKKQTDYFTKVTLTQLPGNVDEQLVFGNPVRTKRYTRAGTRLRKDVFFFAPESLFAIKSLKMGHSGYQASSLYVLKSASPGEAIASVANVTPGARIITEAIGHAEVDHMSSWLVQHDIMHTADAFTPLELVLAEFRMRGKLF